MSEYRTVKSENSDEFIVKKSRFIGYVKPVKTQQEALDFIGSIKTKHWDATHNVYAYIIRETGVKRYSDDGEPQGTAGIPVLDVLEKTGVVVTPGSAFGHLSDDHFRVSLVQPNYRIEEVFKRFREAGIRYE